MGLMARLAGRYPEPFGGQTTMAVNQNIHDIMVTEHRIVPFETVDGETVEHMHTFLCESRKESYDIARDALNRMRYCPACGQEVDYHVP